MSADDKDTPCPRTYFRAVAERVFASHFPLAPAQDPEWTNEDAKALAHFLAGEVGRKLVEKYRYHEQHMNILAVMARSDRDYASGTAAGFRMSLAWFTALTQSVSGTPQDAGIDQSNARGAADLAELLAP